MPMREQSRIKADTVAEECTCSVCHERGCPFPAPAPEPSAPPTGVPVCKAPEWCGLPWGNDSVPAFFDRKTGDSGIYCSGEPWGVNAGVMDEIAYCTEACWQFGEPLNPPPSAPVKPGDVTAWRCSKCHGTEDEHDARGGLCSPPSTPVTVATGGVPAGYRLGDGWEVVGGITDWGCSQEIDSDYCNDTPAFVGPAEDISHPAWQAGACAAHAVEMGALVPATGGNCPTVMDLIADLGKSLVPIDTARSVPPGASLLDSAALSAEWWPTPPSAIVSEPTVRSLSVPVEAIDREVAECRAMERKFPVSRPDHTAVVVALADKAAALEAELADEKAAHDMTRDAVKVAVDCENAARAEVEQLRGKLAEAEKEAREWQEAAVGNEQTADERVLAAGDQATARVRSMREAAESAGYLEATKHHETLLEKGQAVASAIRALPLDTGTATGTSREVTKWALQVAEAWLHRSWSGADMAGGSIADLAATITDAIKAAVADERKRCLAWWEWFWGDTIGRNVRTETGIRSGEDAPGAVTPAKGTP